MIRPRARAHLISCRSFTFILANYYQSVLNSTFVYLCTTHPLAAAPVVDRERKREKKIES